jgi:hypothetical protein
LGLSTKTVAWVLHKMEIANFQAATLGGQSLEDDHAKIQSLLSEQLAAVQRVLAFNEEITAHLANFGNNFSSFQRNHNLLSAV